ncbi:hypothetical protein BRN01_12905 [Xanthomonas oryzae pv. oryzae]|nr:hypothetical protein BRN01_12905 [Xanthomonas oryzae pv. oryzae]
MTWATPFGSEVAQVRSPGSLHNRWCCDPELKPPLQSGAQFTCCVKSLLAIGLLHVARDTGSAGRNAG